MPRGCAIAYRAHFHDRPSLFRLPGADARRNPVDSFHDISAIWTASPLRRHTPILPNTSTSASTFKFQAPALVQRSGMTTTRHGAAYSTQVAELLRPANNALFQNPQHRFPCGVAATCKVCPCLLALTSNHPLFWNTSIAHNPPYLLYTVRLFITLQTSAL